VQVLCSADVGNWKQYSYSTFAHPIINNFGDPGLAKRSGQKKLLILTQTRSGSSFTADIIGSKMHTYIIKEPLYFLQFQNPDQNSNFTSEEVIKYLDNLFNCNVPFLAQKSLSLQNQVWFRTLKKLTLMGSVQQCQESQLIAIKTVRVRGYHVWEWILKHPEIQVNLSVNG
jgi:hypothetical protein